VGGKFGDAVAVRGPSRMTGVALAMVLASALFHATWNFLTKRTNPVPSDTWLFTLASNLIYAPVAVGVFLSRRPTVGTRELIFVLGTGILHTAYFVLLLRGYRVGGLSLVYPLARGTGPLLSTIAAIAFFGEHPSWLAMCGATFIGIGVFVIAGGPRGLRDRGAGQAVVYALLTGGCIAVYTLWDKYAVTTVGLHPVLLDWGGGIVRTALLTPLAVSRRNEVRTRWAAYWREITAVAALSPLGYILVLIALTFTPVSYVAPLRETSILIGAFMGARFLAEGDAPRRLAAAGVMAVGVILLAVG
jgi:drug/metabolite transporter (DMT)-like permease